jgi:hypothetical protein
MSTESPRIAQNRPFSEFRDEGLLWLVNRVVFHPRGYALAISFSKNDDGTTNYDDATGWSIMGDGSESWNMGADPTDEQRALYRAQSEDELFARVKALLR